MVGRAFGDRYRQHRGLMLAKPEPPSEEESFFIQANL
jgi:hypothetical protein